MQSSKPIEGPRLRLRPYSPEDLDFVCSMWLDEENGRYLSDPLREYVDEAYQQALDSLAESPFGYYFTVEETGTGQSVGSCCAFPNEDRTVFDIGYCVHRDHWRKGYGSELLSLLEGWIFVQGADKITAEVAVENIPSNRLLQKRGYAVEKESTFRKYNMDVTYKSFLYAKQRPIP